MKILTLSPQILTQSIVKRNSLSSKSLKYISPSFKADSFQRQEDRSRPDINTNEKHLEYLNQRKERILKEVDTPKSYSSILEEINNKGRQTKEIEELTKEYKILNGILNQSKGNDYIKNCEIVASFVKAMDSMSPNEGFNRIIGYDDIKNDLKNKFILDTVLKEKISSDVEFPHIMLFYGPVGCGKTELAKATAEQSQSNVDIVDAAELSVEDTMDLIEDLAQKSKKNYETSNNKKRTIIVINEADLILNPRSSILNKFKNLANNCSEKYKCTFFLSTNCPLDIDKTFLSKKMTPYKIEVGKADKQTAKAIIDRELKGAKIFIENGSSRITDLLFEKPGLFYSNRDMVEIIRNTMRDNRNPQLNDFLNTIKNNEIVPSIKQSDLNYYKQVNKELENIN